jgi:hypothetical protein
LAIEKPDLSFFRDKNEKIFNTLELYFKNEISLGDVIRRLRYNKPNFQYCFKKQTVIDKYVRFISSEVIK